VTIVGQYGSAIQEGLAPIRADVVTLVMIATLRGLSGQHYVDKVMECYDQGYRNQEIHMLREEGAKLGLKLVPA